MLNISLLKQIATETLPKSLSQQLEPHLDAVSSLYDEKETLMLQWHELEHQEIRERQLRYSELWDAFLSEQRPEWPAYARKHWPEIDEHFNLDSPDCNNGANRRYAEINDDAPF